MTAGGVIPDGEMAGGPVRGRVWAGSRPPCQLYLISPPVFDLAAHAEALKAALGAGGAVAAYQLRMKGAEDADILAAAEILLPICQAADVAFILNDRMDLAKACGADGVHLGQSDGDARAARALLGPDAQIGVTCHASRHFAMEAGEAGANYVAFGAFFADEHEDGGASGRSGDPALVDEHFAHSLAWRSAGSRRKLPAAGGGRRGFPGGERGGVEHRGPCRRRLGIFARDALRPPHTPLPTLFPSYR
jgi:thiamine-phosphate diphosphorylase